MQGRDNYDRPKGYNTHDDKGPLDSNLPLKAISSGESHPRKIRRSIFIGLGGTGNEVIRRLKRNMHQHGLNLPLFQYCVMDTVVYEEMRGMDQSAQLRNGEEYLYIGNYNPNEVLKNLDSWPVISSWWGNRLKTNLVTVDEGAGQMRSVGRMGFFYHFTAIQAQLQRMVQQITDVSNREYVLQQGFDVSNSGPIIYLVFSLCGGTGSSLFFDVAYVLRELLKFSDSPPTIIALAMLPGPYIQSINSIPQQERIQANSYAALTELERLHNMALGLEAKPNGKDLWNVQYASNFAVESASLPFEYIYLIDDTTSKGEKYTRKRLYEQMSRAVFWLSGPSMGSTFWERAKNLIGKTLAGGASVDSSGVKRLPIYSSLGLSLVQYDWQLDRVQRELENRFIRYIREINTGKPTLPPYLNTYIALIEEVSGAQSGVNPIPPSNILLPSGTFKDQAAIDNTLDEFKAKYEAALGRLSRSPMWLRSRDKYRDDAITFITSYGQEALQERGPIATLQELEQISERLTALRTTMIEKMQEQQRLKSEAEALFLTTTHAADQEGPIEKIFYALRSIPGRLYFWEPLRRNSNSRSRDLMVRARNGAQERYRWYDASYNVIIYNDIINTILSPLITLIEEQRKALSGVERDLDAWYRRNENEDEIAYRAQDRLWFENISPPKSERDQIELAVSLDKINLQSTIEQVFKKTFKRWPLAGEEVSEQLGKNLRQQSLDTVKYISGEEHLAQRMLHPELNRERKLFLDGAECLWNFVREGNQETIPYMEAINLLGYGIDPRQHLKLSVIEGKLQELLKQQDKLPDLVATDASDEMVLLKTQHGLMISSLRSINDMQHAYQVMNTVRGAPYLHIDYDYQVRVAYKPLANLEITPRQIMLQWKDMANKLDDKRSEVAEKIRVIIERYRQQSGTRENESIDINTTGHEFFELVDRLTEVIKPLNPTPPVIQSLMRLADMEEILLTQGWVRIEPAFGERADRDLHEVVKWEPRTDMKAERIVEVIHVGYERQRPREKRLIRKARVIASSNASNSAGNNASNY